MIKTSIIEIIKKIIGIIKSFVLKHKIISAIILLVTVVAGYYGFKSFGGQGGQTSYVLGTVVKDSIIFSVAGAGQTSAVNEIDIKPKISGDLTYVAVVGGQIINKGQLIAKIDTTDAQRAVVNAQAALDQVNIDLEKMKGVETSLGKLRGVTEKAQDTLDATYESGFNTVTNAFLNLPTIMTGLQDILFDTTLTGTGNYQSNIDYYFGAIYAYNDSAPQYRQSAYNSYQTARSLYDVSFADFKTTNRTSSKAQIESLINETYDTIGEISQAAKDAINMVQLYQDEFEKQGFIINSISNTHLSSLNGYVNTTNSYLSSLLSTRTSIETGKENLIQTSYDISDQEKLVVDKQTALDDANKNLSYCFIYAPFSGVISAVNVKAGDSVSTGTALAKIITKDVVADISLNEVDASKIKIGQKVTTTFDAIDGLTLTGAVNSIDTVGTVSQGVVSYNVQVNFDTQDDRVKPGMSVSSNIITDTKQNVLTVPNGAVKSKNGGDYVLVPGSSEPEQKLIEIGLADDTNTEIISGLAEGDQIVVRTVSNSSSATTTSSSATRQATQGLFSPGGR